MPFKINIIETDSSTCPVFIKGKVSNDLFPKICAIGNVNILEQQLLGFFCSVKCPGAIILKTYDLRLARLDAPGCCTMPWDGASSEEKYFWEMWDVLNILSQLKN